MSCAACQARVEKAVSKVPGVTSCAVSLLTNSMGVEGTAKPADIIKAVEDAGYGASPKESGKAKGEKQHTGYEAEEEALRDHETPVLKKRLIASVGFLLVLMYISMGHMMFGWPLPGFLDGNHVAMGIAQMLLAVIVMVINQKFFISGFKAVLHGAPNMDTLVAMGSMASFCWSTYVLFAMTGAVLKGDSEAVMTYMHEFYFESAAMIVTLITVGKMLEAKSKGRTTDALKSLMKLAPSTAVIERNGQEMTVPIDDVEVGDIFLVRPGENIPVDGVVTEGISAVNEAALTGESLPVDKAEGSNVSAGTVNQSGFLKCRATKVGRDTTLSQIIQMVSDASATKAPIAKIADKVSGIFVPAVIGIAVLTIAIWLIFGRNIGVGAEKLGFALARGISVLVISCPCALGLATPVAIMVGSGMGAKSGILFKTAVSLEETGKTQIVVLDKTGTITEGHPKVTDMVPAEGVTEEELLLKAAALEKKSEHPLAKAVMAMAEEKGIDVPETADFTSLTGSGVKASLNDIELLGGSASYMNKKVGLGKELSEKADLLANAGKTPLVFSENGKILGIIAVADTIKEDSARAIEELRGMGIRTVMLTGDNEKTAREIAKQAGVDAVVAGLMPDGKEEIIRKLKDMGKVLMVGDGINDAPALTRADIGIAIGAGTDVAIDAADVVVMKSRLSDVSAAIRLSRQTLKNIHENLFWAFFYNVIGIPLAAGMWIPITGWTLNPMFGAAAMSLSSFCVVTNALRLNLFDLHSVKRDKRTKNEIDIEKLKSFLGENTEEKKEEENTMTKTLKVEGMMCEHCEARVKKALEAVDGVTEAVAHKDTKTAVVTLSKDVPFETLKAAVVAQDYEVLGEA